MDTTDTLLRRTLRANAAVSIPWGIAAILGARRLADPLGTPVPATVALGAVAVVAGLLFAAFAQRSSLRPVEGWTAAIGDLGFGTMLVVAALLHPDLTTLGRWLVGASGAVVVDLGILEVVGTMRIAAATRHPRTAEGTADHART